MEIIVVGGSSNSNNNNNNSNYDNNNRTIAAADILVFFEGQLETKHIKREENEKEKLIYIFTLPFPS